MRTGSIVRWLCLLGSLLTAATAAGAEPATAITATLANEPKRPLDLAESIRLTLVVEGPAPLRVEFQEKKQPDGSKRVQLLGDESDREWKVRPVGPSTRSKLGPDRERWQQEFLLTPFVPRDGILAFAPLVVNGQEILGPACAVKFNPPAMDANPDRAMGITGVEGLDAPVSHRTTGYWWWLAVPFVAASVLVIVWRLRRGSPPVPPREWALQAFDQLERGAGSNAAFVAAVADVVREFVERQLGIPALKRTTEELLSAAEQAAWPVEQTDPLRRLLDDCDRAKFAGDIPDDDGCRNLLARAREWVNLVCPEPGPG